MLVKLLIAFITVHYLDELLKRDISPICIEIITKHVYQSDVES